MGTKETCYMCDAPARPTMLKTVDGLEVGAEKTKDVNLLELIEDLKKSVVMIKVY